MPEMVGLTYVLYNGQVIRQIVRGSETVADFTYPWEKWVAEEYREPMTLDDLIGAV